ncbi:MAG: lantibiotic ABC transporter [Bacteroidales bacterium]|nr:lantibiotic ABC transporter [Bacteroidales bacterium]
MKGMYYITLSGWNLLESFVTESISPYLFYGERDFGNNLSRYLNNKNDKTEFLLLTTKDSGGDYTLVVDGQLLDDASMKPANKSKTAFTYNQTIYYKKGMVKFRFATEELLNSLVAESQILYEVKCVEKYSSDFVVKEIKAKGGKMPQTQEFSFERNEFVGFDNVFNRIKGAVVGYVRGLLTTTDSQGQKLILELRNLKNAFTALHTQIMTSDAFDDNPLLSIMLNNCKGLYSLRHKATSNFDVIYHQYSEIVNLAKMRSDEIRMDNSGEKKMLMRNLQTEISEIKKQMSAIERENDLYEVKVELQSIKDLEQQNGLRNGKKRQFFKKGSPEFERKKELERKIKEFEENNSEYKSLTKDLDDAKSQIASLTGGRHKYDATLSAIFMRISDIINDMLSDLAKETNSGNVDLNCINLNGCKLEIKETLTEQLLYFNILLNTVVSHKTEKMISDVLVLQFIETSANEYKKTAEINKEDRNTILNSLREFYLYKSQKSDFFTIPDSMPILQAIMAFFVKPLGFDQIERYMLNKKFMQKSYSFMLWGACKGFADLPKTFTNILYSDEKITSEVDDFLFTLRNII